MRVVLIFCIVTPWILAETNNDGNNTVQAATHVDDTRREDLQQSSNNHSKTSSQPIVKKEIDKLEENNTKNEESVNLRNFDQSATLEQIKLNDEPCDNAQFLLKILTGILPLLKRGVSESGRTSYVLEILKDLLRSSPEAAKDHEVMFKINDLLQTLEKHQYKGLGDDNRALRRFTNDIFDPNSVKAKITFKYELPHFDNPDCTEELLTIIKVVQHAILKLVNNPVCKSAGITSKWPLLVDLDSYLQNHEHYSYLPELHPSNFPTDKIYLIPHDESLTHYDLPSHAILPYPNTPKGFEPYQVETYIISPDGHKIKNPSDFLNPYDSAPNYLPLVNGAIDIPVYPKDSETENSVIIPLDEATPKPNFYPPSSKLYPFDQYEFEPSLTQAPVELYEGTIHENTVIPWFETEHSKNGPMEFFGSGGSTVVNIGHDKEIFPSYVVPGENPFEALEVEPQVSVPIIEKIRPLYPTTDIELEEYHPIEIVWPAQNPEPPYLDSLPSENRPESSVYHVPELPTLNDIVGDIQINQNRPYPAFEFDLPSNEPKLDPPYDEHSSNSLPSPHFLPEYGSDVFQHGYGNSADFEINEHIPSSHLEIIGTPGSGEVQVNHILPSRPSELPPFLIPGDDSREIQIDEFQPKTVFEFDFPSSSSPSPFAVSGSGTGENQIGQNRPYPSFEFDLPSNEPKLHHPQYDEHSSNSFPSPIYLPEYGFDVIEPNENKPNPVFEFDLEHKQPKPYPTMESQPPFVVSGDGSGEIELYQNLPDPAEFEFDLPENPKPISILDESPSVHLAPSSSPFVVTGDGSGEIVIENHQNPIYELNFPSQNLITSPFDVTGSANSASIPFGQPSYPDDLYIIRPEQGPINNHEYDSSPDSLHEIKGELPPDNHHEGPNMPAPFEITPNLPYDHLSPETLHLPFEVTGDGSGVIDIESPTLFPEDLYLPEIPKDEPKYPHDFDLPDDVSDPLIIDSPEALLPLQDAYEYYDDAEGTIKLVRPRPHEEYYPSVKIQPEDYIISEPIRPLKPQIDLNVIPNENRLPYEELHFEELYPEYFDTARPIPLDYINPNVMPENDLPNDFSWSPDTKVLLIIDENVRIIEHKIPKTQLSSEIRELIRLIKELIHHHQITIEEYVTIVKHYEILIDLIKHLNIGNEILEDLLLSMTNEGKLELQTGKSNLIELTYLIKPTPVIYQPYYYIKYRLPYVSFITRIKKILATKPYLSDYPSKLYKELIPISNVAETSPDLEGFEKEDILKITFNKGTLVGAKVIKGNDLNMYSTLDSLEEINSDFTMEDIYKLIKNLDAQLKYSSEDGLVNDMSVSFYKKPVTNINSYVDKVLVKVKEHPTISKKVTHITSKKLTSNHQMIDNIMNQVNNLRSNVSSHHLLENSTLTTDTDGSKTDNSVSITENSRNTYQSNQSKNTNPSIVNDSLEDINTRHLYNQERSNNDGKHGVAYDYIPLYSDNSKEVFLKEVPPKGDKIYSNHAVSTNSDKEKDYSYYRLHNTQSVGHLKKPTSSIESKLLDATLNAFPNQSNNPKQTNFESVSFESSKDSPQYFTDNFNAANYNWEPPAVNQHYLPLAQKLQDATVNARFEEENPMSQMYVNSEGSPESVRINDPNLVEPQSPTNQETNSGPKLLDATLQAHFEKENDQISQLHVNSNPLITSSFRYMNGHPNSVNPLLLKHSHYFNSIPVHSKMYAINNPENILNQFHMHNNNQIFNNRNNFMKLYQTYPVLNNNNKYLASNVNKFSVMNQNVYKNRLVNPYYQYLTQPRVPFVYKQSRKPWTHFRA